MGDFGGFLVFGGHYCAKGQKRSWRGRNMTAEQRVLGSFFGLVTTLASLLATSCQFI
jgi:hypothetical protein